MFDVFKQYFHSGSRIGGQAVRKPKQDAATSPPKPYLAWLMTSFVAWKTLLLLVAYASPGPGYDTSTRILFDQYNVQPHSWLSQVIEDLTLRLTRWDALYFTTSSARGHLYEQEWAFSWFMSRLTALLSNAFPSFLHTSPIIAHAFTGVVISHLSHLGAVVTLYSLVRRIIPSDEEHKQQIAFTTACLHIISPAGLFLSSPYGESTFAFAAFLGLLCYIRAQEHHATPTAQSTLPIAAWILLSGLAFALSTLIRSNGLLHGTVFLTDALTTLRALLATRSAANLSRLLSILIAGSLIAIAFILPQTIAYLEFCTPSASRPWCSYNIPSIYSWVQKHYWNVGFLAYWTPGNIPLFLLAAPMLLVLVATAFSALREPGRILASLTYTTTTEINKNTPPASQIKAATTLFTHVIFQLAIPQAILAVAAVTNFHVQIINRISSGCALWYIVLAISLHDQSPDSRRGLLGVLGGKRREVLVRLMVAYAVVQGGLYAAFLPPA